MPTTHEKTSGEGTGGCKAGAQSLGRSHVCHCESVSRFAAGVGKKPSHGSGCHAYARVSMPCLVDGACPRKRRSGTRGQGQFLRSRFGAVRLVSGQASCLLIEPREYARTGWALFSWGSSAGRPLTGGSRDRIILTDDSGGSLWDLFLIEPPRDSPANHERMTTMVQCDKMSAMLPELL
jgi:hypothetical protein